MDLFIEERQADRRTGHEMKEGNEEHEYLRGEFDKGR